MAASRGGAVEGALADLRDRLEELHRWVEVLHDRGFWPGLEGQPPPPAPVAYPPAPDPASPPRHEDRSRQPIATPGTEPEPAVTEVDAGPFADLIELRHFEEALAALPATRGVLVRRYGRGRARIAVGASSHALTQELHRLGRPLALTPGAGDGLRVELLPPVEAASAGGAAESRAGGGT